jgi:N-methylhydantoinase B
MKAMRPDPTELEIFKNLFHSVAEEMGAALRRSAFSPNIKERRDYSCAVFDGAGAGASARAVAMGDHMPVHLGSMPISVAAAIEHFSFPGGSGLQPGDIVMLNDPYAGGTHLPRSDSQRAHLSSTWRTARTTPTSAARSPPRWA